jgi:hypothetical protein
MKTLSITLALALAAPAVSLAASSFAYVPGLTGAYTVGGFDPTFRKVHDIDLSWEEGSPRYLSYELSGVLRDPVVLDPASHVGSPGLEEINFNGTVEIDWRAEQEPLYDSLGVGWGTGLNSGMNFDIGALQIRKDHDPSTGRFYIAATLDLQAQCDERMMGETCRLSEMGLLGAKGYAAAHFLNYQTSFVEVTMSDPGFVFVESARVGLSDRPLGEGTPPLLKIVDYSTAVPEPSATWMFGVGLLAMGWRSAMGRPTRRCSDGPGAKA